MDSHEELHRIFEAIDRQYRKRLCFFVSKYTKSSHDAEEIVQKTLLKAFLSYDSLKNKEKIGVWLYRTAYRIAVDEFRRQKTLPLDPTQDWVDPQPDSQNALQQKEEHENLWKTARKILSPDEFTAVWLRYMEESSCEEIAATMQRTNGSVRILLFRARKKLLEHLEIEQ